MALDVEASPLESRPAILLVGSPNVGKRTILSRLLSIDSGDDTLDSTTGMLCHGWTIDTKYYSVDVSIWTVHLEEDFSLRALPMPSTLAALLMVFDLNDLESFSTLKSWVSNLDLARFDILLCIGNKVDLLSGHFAHAEYRRHLEKCGASSGDPHLEFAGYGILDTEGSSLLGEDEIPWEIRSCLDWCLQHNIEYVEACALNPVFDKCLSVNGDVQGMDRIYVALSAHMWPGMVLKSGNRVVKAFSLENEDLDASDEGSEFELEYEVLSSGSVEPWGSDDSWVAFTEAEPQVSTGEGSSSQGVHIFDVQPSDPAVTYKTEVLPSTSEPMLCMNGNSGASILEKSSVSEERLLVGNLRQDDEKDGHFSEPEEETFVCTPNSNSLGSSDSRVRPNQNNENHEEKLPEHEDLEHLMSEIGTVRDNLRLMPDFQRREMAAMLAMKVAAMFDCGSDDEGSE